MSSQISISFFPVNNSKGNLLKDKVKSLIKDELKLELKIYESALQEDFSYSCMHDDIVIFDASIELEDNYAIATTQPMAMDHVLIVSRTYLPLNFFGLREGGAPDYPTNKPNEDTNEYTKSNEEIIEWLREQVLDLKLLSPRPEGEKKLSGSIKTMDKSIELQEERRNKVGQVFISYRSKYYDKVNDLKNKIEMGRYHGGNKKTVCCFPPGKLVYEDEMLTEQRCWQLVSMIDRTIGASDELWMYKTDDYFDSWWTRAELITLSYRKFSSNDLPVPKIKIYDPNENAVYDVSEDYLPQMTKDQRKRMARWYANSDPATMGPENLWIMRFYAKMPLVGSIKYFHDHVWSEEFWTKYLVPCIGCRSDPKFKFPDKFDIDAFLWIGLFQESNKPSFRELQKDKFGFIRLSPDQLKESFEKNRFVCPYCKSTFSVEKGKYPRFLWLPSILQRKPVNVFETTTPEFSNLAKFPVYRVRGTV